MADQNFISDLATKLQERIEAKELSTQKELHDAKIIEATAPERWNELKQWARTAVSQLNQQLSKQALVIVEGNSPNDFTVYCDDARRSVKANFVSLFGSIEISSNANANYTFEPQVNGNKLRYVSSPSVEVSIEDIGKKMLSEVAK